MLQEKVGIKYTRLGLILAQFRHFMWHMGTSSATTFMNENKWPKYTGYK